MLGTPQGIAVYQDGVRVNEVFGDTVNWDFIPQAAVHRLTLVPNSPIFGLNAIGGAISVEMKNGFTYQGKEAEVMGGSFGRIHGAAQAGFEDGNIAGYASFDAAKDDGWRQFNASSQLKRMYFNLGARNDQSEFHLSFTGADNTLAGTVGTPLEMLILDKTTARMSSLAVKLRLDDILNGFVGAVIGRFEAAVWAVLRVGAVVEAAVCERPAQPFMEEQEE